MEKLELEPLRRLGYALDVATLQQVAYDHGITQSFMTMTQAQKAQLRYIAIMEQSGNALGDMAATVQTPANALRILQQEFTQLSRAVGNLFIPALQRIIPVVRVVVEAITEAIQFLADLLGFELPTIDYSGLDGMQTSIEGVESGLGGAASAAKEFKKQLLGIDELNIIEPQAAGGGGAGGGAFGNMDLGLDMPEYDFLSRLAQSTDELKGKFDGLLSTILDIGAGFAGWAIAKSVLGWFNDLKMGKFSKIDKLAAGIGLVITGFSLEWQAGYDIGYNGPNLKNVIKGLIGAALGVAGSLLIFGTGPLGWTIGLGTALTIGITSFLMGYDRRKIDDELNRRFGEIELSVAEAKELAQSIMSSPLSIQLDMYVEAKTTAKQAIENYLSASQNLDYLLWKVSVGLDVDTVDILSSVDSAVSSAQNVLNTQQERYMLAINVGLRPGALQTEMATFTAEYFSGAQNELTSLGQELRNTIDLALADGVLSSDEMETVARLQSEYQQLINTVADAKYKAEITNITYGLQGDLSLESLNLVREELLAKAQEQINALESANVDVMTAINLRFKDDPVGWQKATEEAMQNLELQKMEVNIQAFEPIIGEYYKAFGSEVVKAQPLFDKSIQDLINDSFGQFATDETGRLVNGSIQQLMIGMSDSWQTEIANLDIDDSTRKALEEILMALEPNIADLQKIANNFIAMGQTVPENLAKGLHEYNAMAALTGNLDAINYLLGEKFSTDPAFLEALTVAEDAGKYINDSMAQGLLNNLEIVNNANGTISLINDTIGNKVLEITPQLTQTLKDLGVDITSLGLSPALQTGGATAGDNLINSFSGKITSRRNEMTNNARSLGGYLSDGVLSGIEGKKSSLFSGLDTWANGIIKRVKKTFGVHSPSTVFRDEIGLNLGLGIAAGFANSEKNILSTITGITGDVQKQFDTVDVQKWQVPRYDDMAVRHYHEFSANSENTNSTQSENNPIHELAEVVIDEMHEIINAMYATTQQSINAFRENGQRPIYMDGRKVADATTSLQQRHDLMYGR